MDWSCIAAEERLSDFMEGALSPEESAAFSAHTAACRPCAEMVKQVTDLMASLRDMPAPAIPPYLVKNILDATAGPRKAPQSWRRWIAWTPAIWGTRFAMGLGTIAASLLIVIHAANRSSVAGEARNLELNPAHIVHAANRQAHLTYARGAKFVSDLRVVYQIESQLRPDSAQAPAQGGEQQEAPAPRQETEPERREAPRPPITRDFERPLSRGGQARTASRVILAMTLSRQVNNARRSS